MSHITFAVMIHFGNVDMTNRAIISLNGNSEDVKIVLVDNTSGKNLYSKRKNLRYIKNKKNLGYSGGNNIGISYCLEKGAEDILLLNNDTFFRDNALISLRKALWEKQGTGIVGPKILNSDGQVWFGGGYIDKKRYTAGHYGFDKLRLETEDNEIDFISGCAMLIKSEVFKKVGLFDERFFLYYEDVDFSERAKEAGFEIRYVPESIVYHEKKMGTPLIEYYQERNHLLFIEKHAPLRIRVRELIRLPKTVLEIYKERDKKIKQYRLRGVFDYLRRKFGEYDYRN